jgi:hypothetical protein
LEALSAAKKERTLSAGENRVVDCRLEAVHPVLIHQHIVMVMDWDELAQVAAFNFAFVQHGFPFG